MSIECYADKCERLAKQAGLCGMHYLRKWRHGDTNKRLCSANGEGGVSSQGYFEITVNGRRVLEHIHIAEKAIGKRLPKGSHVHHINGVKTDNRGCNLVICQDAGYHFLLHKRQEALDACGNPDLIKCRICGQYDKADNLYISPGRGYSGHHRKCRQLTRGSNK